MEASTAVRFTNPFMNWRVNALVIGPALIHPETILLIYESLSSKEVEQFAQDSS
jgi:hypothetical protein